MKLYEHRMSPLLLSLSLLFIITLYCNNQLHASPTPSSVAVSAY
jgi:hypothetical protein